MVTTGQIKSVFETQIGRLSQCLVSQHFLTGKVSPQLVGNIVMKVNVKLGGFNHGVCLRACL